MQKRSYNEFQEINNLYFLTIDNIIKKNGKGKLTMYTINKPFPFKNYFVVNEKVMIFLTFFNAQLKHLYLTKEQNEKYTKYSKIFIL